MAESKPDPTRISSSEKDVEAPNITEKSKEGTEATNQSPVHDKETHGRSQDINENTPIDVVKGPGVFERAKEEIEALVGAVLPKKDKNQQSSSK